MALRSEQAVILKFLATKSQDLRHSLDHWIVSMYFDR
jgi:hypothetical protein